MLHLLYYYVVINLKENTNYFSDITLVTWVYFEHGTSRNIIFTDFDEIEKAIYYKQFLITLNFCYKSPISHTALNIFSLFFSAFLLQFDRCSFHFGVILLPI